MYSLRSINNMYSEHAGTRSDFIIVGHPEFQMGKVRSCTRGMPSGWDDRQIPSKPGRNIARARSFGALVCQLTDMSPRGTLKERAHHRTAKLSPPRSPRVALHHSFDAFLAELLSPTGEDLPGRTAASFAQTKGWTPVCRRFSAIEYELDKLRKRYKVDPEATVQSLKDNDVWQYYASHLEQAQKINNYLKREIQRWEPQVKAHCTAPGIQPRKARTAPGH